MNDIPRAAESWRLADVRKCESWIEVAGRVLPAEFHDSAIV
ncbi:hypothetical protein ACFV9C_11215 [Kribbella sp. NPDC059898]